MMNNNFNNNGTNNNSNNNSNNGGKFIMANNTINSLEVFADVIKEAFLVTYPDAMFRVHEVKKNNGLVLTGLSICKKDTNMAPTIYLDGFFKQYRMGRAVADIIKEIDTIYRQHSVDVNFEEASVTEFSRVQDKICFKLVNKERNKEVLADAPYVDFFDLAVVFYILVAEDAEGTASILVHNNLMKAWGNPDVMELYMLAKANTQRYFNGRVYNMMSVIESIIRQRMIRRRMKLWNGEPSWSRLSVIISQRLPERLWLKYMLCSSIQNRMGFKQVTFNKTIKRITRKRTEVPIWEKATLTLEEAAEFSGIGIHKIRELTEAKNCKFVLWNGNRRLIKRKKFEEFIDGSFSI